jgi:hypothetical protein
MLECRNGLVLRFVDVGRSSAVLLREVGLRTRPGDRWEPGEIGLVEQAVADLLIAARWNAATFRGAVGGPIALVREREHPIVTDAAGVRYPVLGLYDSRLRALTVNNWNYDERTGGEAAGRRVILHELAHAWDRRSRHLLSLGLRWLPGARASAYARSSRFDDWAKAVMGAVYGADPGHEVFDRDSRGRPSPRLRYVRAAFARYRRVGRD